MCVCSDTMFALNGGRNLFDGVYFTTLHSFSHVQPDFCTEIKLKGSEEEFLRRSKILVVSS